MEMDVNKYNKGLIEQMNEMARHGFHAKQILRFAIYSLTQRSFTYKNHEFT